MPEDTPEVEPTATSEPPGDIDIPVSTPFGDNLPIAPLPTQESQVQEVPPAQTAEESPTQEQPQNPKNAGKSIKIPGELLLGIMAMLLAGAFAIGYIAKPSTKIQSPDPKTNNQTTKTGFTPDQGYYKRENVYNAEELISLRAKAAKKSIIWITSEPNNEAVLTALAATKNSKALPIFILCGKEVTQQRLKKAQDFGFSIHQLEEELESPYSFLFVDETLLIDASRSHWLWETKEPKILSNTSKWASDLIQNSKIAH